MKKEIKNLRENDIGDIVGEAQLSTQREFVPQDQFKKQIGLVTKKIADIQYNAETETATWKVRDAVTNRMI